MKGKRKQSGLPLSFRSKEEVSWDSLQILRCQSSSYDTGKVRPIEDVQDLGKREVQNVQGGAASVTGHRGARVQVTKAKQNFAK